jgi:hypothetical protein
MTSLLQDRQSVHVPVFKATLLKALLFMFIVDHKLWGKGGAVIT